MPTTMRNVSFLVWTFKVFGQGICEVNQLDMGVILFVAPKSKIKESRRSEFSTEVESVRILLKIKFLPELATVVDQITSEDLAGSASHALACS